MNKKLLVGLANIEHQIAELAREENSEEWQILMVNLLKNLYKAQSLVEDLK